jgi:hypothetical protein
MSFRDTPLRLEKQKSASFALKLRKVRRSITVQ